MSFNVTSKIKLDLPKLKQLDKNSVKALEMTTDALLTEVKNSQVMPFKIGTLQNDSTFAQYDNSDKGITQIVSSTPYARRLYYHPEYNFNRDENAAAGGEWFKPWLPDGTRQNFCSETFAKIYKELTGI